MRAEFNIIMIAAILMSASLFLIYQNPDEVPNSTSFQRYSYEIIQINEQAKKHQAIENVEKFDELNITMQEKIKEISLNLTGMKVSKMTFLEGQYPFLDVNHIAEKLNLDPSAICAFEQDIPLHLEKISETSNFQMFAKKYSSHAIELIMMDERNDISNIHYGLIATNSKDQSASTYFHVDSCTNEITDREPYSLKCSDKNNDYKFATFNRDDVVSSYSNGHFCKIELDSWRQSVYDYSKTLQEKHRLVETESMAVTIDQESQWKLFSEMSRQGDLGNIVGRMVHDQFDEQGTQDLIEQYEKQHSSLPDELLELIEKRK